MGEQAPHVYLIDGSGYIFRAYHALPPLTRKSDGAPVGAVSGFCNMLHKLLDDTRAGDKPTHIAVIFDTARAGFRTELYPAYKANRPPAPEDLVPQFAMIRDAVRAFNVESVEMEGFEADDLIATYAEEAVRRGGKVTIVSSDKDLMQLVTPDVALMDPMKSKRIGRDDVIEKFGVPPEKVIDVQALAGDSADNVPGVPGIGVKTAAELITTYGDLDTLLDRAPEIKQPKRRESLIANAELARISRTLVTLRKDAPVPVPFEAMATREHDTSKLLDFLEVMEFRSLARRVAMDAGIDPTAAATADGSAQSPAPRAQAAVAMSEPGGADGPGALPFPIGAPINLDAYVTIRDLETLKSWLKKAEAQGYLCVDCETTSLDPMQAELVGVALALAPGDAAYVPLRHRPANDGFDLSGDGPIDQLAPDAALGLLKPVLEDPAILKIGQNLKYDMAVFAQAGICLAPVDDTMLMSYALDAGRGSHGMDALSEQHLGHTPIAFKDVAGTGKAQVTFDRVPVDKATRYAAEDADVTLRLYALLKPRLAAERLATVYETLERPLVPVLSAMERAGIAIDKKMLAELSAEFTARMGDLESEIHQLAGKPFNIASPKQLGEILFDDMKLKSQGKTKTGAYSTSADVLEELAAEGHALPAKVLDWRQLAKLKGTYTDALPEFVNPVTSRVHTSYALAATTTGRLASTDPNLQNIPIRTEEGRKIRYAFIAEPGNRLISADYSQIELRLLAEIADIPALKKAFAEGLDIHAMTASEMFNVPIAGMDPMIRRRAKAINFGIIYGISAFGLAAQLGIPRGEADGYIKNYFERFPGIRRYMDDTKEFARRNGFVETMFGRRIHLPGINDRNPSTRAFIERQAINAPIQGSAADVIRRAMIRLPDALTAAGLKARMLLQVHDELIFEVPEAEEAATITLVKQIMSRAAEPALKLSVPLVVDAGAGRSWGDAH